MATTSGYVEVGPGKTFTTWSALIADLDDLTGNLYVMQTGNTSEPGTPYAGGAAGIDLNGYALTFDSDTPHYGVAGVGNLIQVLANPGTPIVRMEVNGTGTFEVKNLQVDETGLTDAETAFQLINYSGSVDIVAHDLIAIGSLLDVELFGVIGISLQSLGGDIDAWNLKAYHWNDVGIGIAPGYFGSGSGRFENLTAYYCANYGIWNVADGFAFGGAGIVRNCVSVGSLTSDFSGFNLDPYAGYNNASSDASAGNGIWGGGGSSNFTTILPAEFKSLVSSDPDFLMVASGGVLEGSGSAVQIPSNTKGIRGNDRPGSDALYSVGADEYGTTGPGPGPGPTPSSSSSDTPITPSVTVQPTVSGKTPNLGRTLLLNASGADRPGADFYGEEYVPPYYRPVDLPSGLLTVRRALFGTTPDTAGMNYSVWQYMRLLHSTEYGEYITDLDSRITYLGDRSLVGYGYGPLVQPAAGLEFTGDPGLGGADGRLRATWDVELAGATITVKCLTTPHQESFNVDVVDGITSYVPLVPYNNYKARVDTSLGETAWTIEYIAPPTTDMSMVARAAAISKIGAQAYETLFPRRAPYDLFRELWEQHPHLPYKLSGVLLALIHLTNEHRLGTNA